MADERTLSDMITRIASELQRDDLGSASNPLGDTVASIRSSIIDTIYNYQPDYFFIGDAVDATTLTTQGTNLYDLPADFVEVTQIDVVSASTVYTLVEELYQIIDAWDTDVTNPTQGIPEYFAIYNDQVRLYPTPDYGDGSSVGYTIRYVYQAKISVPVTDDTFNFWTTTAEELIRCGARYRLNMEVIRDVQAAQLDKQRELEAYQRLVRQSAPRLYTGKINPTAF